MDIVRTVDVAEVEKQDGTGAQQEMDGVDSRFKRTNRGGTGQGKDSDEG